MLGRVEAVPLELGGDGVAVGGKGAGFDQDPGSAALGPEEARQHQVDVHRQRVHGDDFMRACARQVCQSGGEVFVVRNPGTVRVLMSQYRQA